MQEIVRVVGPTRALELFGIRLVGVNAENGLKLLISLVLFGCILLFTRLSLRISRSYLRERGRDRAAFWTHQMVMLAAAVLGIIGLTSIWFDDAQRLTTGIGLVTAGLAFALQKVVAAIAAYFIILRGRTFDVGDRIVMGGVRGDVIGLGFTQTTIMEMGQPPPVQGAQPAMWVQSRQYTGRVVTVSNAKIFDEPVYNYTREFPYLWEELAVPFPYATDHARAEEIMLAAAREHTVRLGELGEAALREMRRRYAAKPAELEPRVFYRLTDNWVELSVRFIVEDHGIRAVKDAMSRTILRELRRARIEIASTTLSLVGIPKIEVASLPGEGKDEAE